MKKMTKLFTMAFVLLLMLTAVQPASATDEYLPAYTEIPDGCYCVNLDGEYAINASNLNLNEVLSAFFTTTSLPFDYTLPYDFVLTSGYTLPADYTLNVDLTLPFPISIGGTYYPAGTAIPAGTTIPAGITIPADVKIPAGTTIPAGFTLPAEYVIPPCVTIPLEYEAEADLKVCKSGQNVDVTIVSSTPSVPEGLPDSFAIQITNVQIIELYKEKLTIIATMSPVSTSYSVGQYTFTGEMELDIQENGKLIYSSASGRINDAIPVDASLTMTVENCSQEEIPEFPTIALPVAAIIGLAFFMQRRKE
jgi:hypothetical protein